MYDNANHFNNKDFATQVMLHQQLYRKLLKYAYDNNAEVTTKTWTTDTQKWTVIYDNDTKQWTIHGYYYMQSPLSVYFTSQNVATSAIKEVIEPFIKEHPKFVR